MSKKFQKPAHFLENRNSLALVHVSQKLRKLSVPLVGKEIYSAQWRWGFTRQCSQSSDCILFHSIFLKHYWTVSNVLSTHFEAAVDFDGVGIAVASRSDAVSIVSERAGSGLMFEIIDGY